jgi:hypothetical protein
MKMEREGIKEVLILQYSLHEVMHHRDMEEGPWKGIVEPKAHVVSDIYKCLHQGIFGIGHNIQSQAEFAHRLAYDLENARTASAAPPHEPLFENVSPDGAMLRVNLRPFRASLEGEVMKGCEQLLRVCLHSAAMVRGSTERFFAVLEYFRDLNGSEELEVGGKTFAFQEETVRGFLKQVKKFFSDSGFVPVLSHSPVYRHFNKPSYRVVCVEALLSSPLAFLSQGPHGVKPGNGN